MEEKSSATSREREARVLQELSQEKVDKVIVPPRLRLRDTAQCSGKPLQSLANFIPAKVVLLFNLTHVSQQV